MLKVIKFSCKCDTLYVMIANKYDLNVVLKLIQVTLTYILWLNNFALSC